MLDCNSTQPPPVGGPQGIKGSDSPGIRLWNAPTSLVPEDGDSSNGPKTQRVQQQSGDWGPLCSHHMGPR